MIRPISSATNHKFKMLASLLHSRGISENQLCLVSGMKIIQDLERYRPDIFVGCVYAENTIHALPISLPVEEISLSGALFKELDVFGTNYPLALVRTDLPARKTQPCSRRVVLALQNPDNLGAALRTAKAFAFENVLLCKESANPFLPKSLRAAGPAAFTLQNIERGPRLAEIAETPQRVPRYILDMSGASITDVKFPKEFELVVGTEGPGVPKSMEGERITIPIHSAVESLNAVAALAIAMFAAVK